MDEMGEHRKHPEGGEIAILYTQLIQLKNKLLPESPNLINKKIMGMVGKVCFRSVTEEELLIYR